MKKSCKHVYGLCSKPKPFWYTAHLPIHHSIQAYNHEGMYK